MVLGGGEETRPFVAAALVKAGLAGKVLVPKASPSLDGEVGILPPAHEVSRSVLRHRGVADADIVILDRPVLDTYGEAVALAEFLDSAPGARVSVVTNDFHTRRARWVFRHVLGARASQVSFVAAPNERFFEASWWQFEDGFHLVVGEYLKLAYYVLRYSPRHVAVLTGVACLLAAVFAFLRRRSTRHGETGWYNGWRREPGSTGSSANLDKGKRR
jgi:uncharacterized SAM-binding protein YcdF (DUF218 family)